MLLLVRLMWDPVSGLPSYGAALRVAAFAVCPSHTFPAAAAHPLLTQAEAQPLQSHVQTWTPLCLVSHRSGCVAMPGKAAGSEQGPSNDGECAQDVDGVLLVSSNSHGTLAHRTTWQVGVNDASAIPLHRQVV